MAAPIEIIQDALYELGARAPGDAIPAEDSEVCLRYLNRIMDGLNADSRNAYTENIATYALQAKSPHTIGIDSAGVLTADFAANRPVRIDRANLIITGGAYPIRKQLEILSDQQWANVRIQTITSPIPLKLYNDGAYPLSSIYLWPVPSNTSYQLEIFSAPLFAPFADLVTQVYFPPLYEDAIVKRLAKRVARIFGKVVPADLDREEREAWDAIQAQNEEPPLLACDPGAFGSTVRPTFNVFIGE